MRPVLFSLGSNRAFSGLRIREVENPAHDPFDILIDIHTLADIKKHDEILFFSLLPENYKGALRLRNVCQAFRVNDRVRIERITDLRPYASLEVGELGTVENVNSVTGEVDIHLDAYHYGLHYRSNCAWLVPFGTDDILNSFALLRKPTELSVCA